MVVPAMTGGREWRKNSGGGRARRLAACGESWRSMCCAAASRNGVRQPVKKKASKAMSWQNEATRKNVALENMRQRWRETKIRNQRRNRKRRHRESENNNIANESQPSKA